MSKTNVSKVPNELKNAVKWVLWKGEMVKDRLTKIPYSIVDGKFQKCDATNDKYALEFDEAMRIAQENMCDGLGFILDGEGFVIVDVDHCVQSDGTFTDIANQLLSDVDLCTTYVEYSQSGKGLHIIFSDFDIDGIAGRKNSDLEIYANKRFFAITGYRLDGYGADIAYLSGKTRELIGKYFDGANRSLDDNAQVDIINAHSFTPHYTDSQILSIIRHSRNREKFNALFYRGDTSLYGGDDSSADFALMGILAFYTGGNAVQMDRIFNQSKLAQRDKWLRDDYRLRTVANSINYWVNNGSVSFTPADNFKGVEQPMKNENEKLYTTKEAAEYLKDVGIKVHDLKNWRKRELFGVKHFIPAVRTGNTVYYTQEQLDQIKPIILKGNLSNVNKAARHLDDLEYKKTIRENENNSQSYGVTPQTENNLKDVKQSEQVEGEFKQTKFKNTINMEIVAGMLGVSKMTLSRWDDDGTLKAEYRDHNGYMNYDRGEVEKFIIKRHAKKKKEGAAQVDSTGIKPVHKLIELYQNGYHSGDFGPLTDLAMETISTFMALDTVTTGDIFNEDFLYAAGYIKLRQTDDLLFQGAMKDIRDKCKRYTKMTGSGGLDATFELYANKFKDIADFFIEQDAEKNRQTYLDKLSKQADLAADKGFPLPFNDVVMPTGYHIDLDTQSTTTFDKFGRPMDDFNSIQVVTRRIINVDTGLQKIEVQTLKKNATRWSRVVATRDFFADNRKIVSLSASGLDVISRNAAQLVDYLNDFETLNYGLIEQVYTVNKTGWRGADFVYPNSPNCPFDLDDSIKSQVDKVYTTGGNASITLDIIKKVKHIDAANISIGTALAAPLVSIFKIDNIAVHIYAQAGSGKSLILKLAVSLFANPNNDTEAIAPADSTRAGLEAYFAAHHDLIAAVDDIENVQDKRREVIQQLPYQFVNNKGRLRAKPKGGNDVLIDYSGALLVNGERPLSSDNSKGGIKRRLIEIKADDKMLDGHLARDIALAVKHNYGLIGRRWIDYIIEHSGELVRDFHTVMFGDNDNGFASAYEGKIPLHIYSIAAITVANIHFDTLFLNLDREAAFYKELDCADRVLKSLPDESEMADFQRAKLYITDWISANPKHFMTPSNEAGKEWSAEAYETYGTIRHDIIAVIPTVLNKMLTDNGFSADMVLRQLADDGFIQRGNKAITKVIRINDKTQRMIVFDKLKLYPQGEE